MRFLIFCSLALLTGQPASAQTTFSGENLLLRLPTGFEEGYQATRGSDTISEYVPEGETVEDWTRMLTIQIFREAGDADPVAYLGQLGTALSEACPGSGGNLLGQEPVDGLPAAAAFYVCPAAEQDAPPQEVFLTQAIAGRDALYVVQIAWHDGPEQDELRQWIAYLQEAGVCDTRRDEMPCPD
ncbi:hypothetical protein [Nioella nitratireducens]|uniref:hypothetical protein n=1 Tax=Nioella nitratireducens TaxID=1287720 RepID=UPI0008FD6EC0|nr:hypothetical protein [Nioella nitratireducens]